MSIEKFFKTCQVLQREGVNITMFVYNNGFTVGEEGHFRSFQDPTSMQFLAQVQAGLVHNTLIIFYFSNICTHSSPDLSNVSRSPALSSRKSFCWWKRSKNISWSWKINFLEWTKCQLINPGTCYAEKRIVKLWKKPTKNLSTSPLYSTVARQKLVFSTLPGELCLYRKTTPWISLTENLAPSQ